VKTMPRVAGRPHRAAPVFDWRPGGSSKDDYRNTELLLSWSP
jgi:hypothetical protein